MDKKETRGRPLNNDLIKYLSEDESRMFLSAKEIAAEMKISKTAVKGRIRSAIQRELLVRVTTSRLQWTAKQKDSK